MKTLAELFAEARWNEDGTVNLENFIDRLDMYVHSYFECNDDHGELLLNDIREYTEQVNKPSFTSYGHRTTQEFPSSSGVTSGYPPSEPQDSYVQNTSPAVSVIQASLLTCGD